MASSHFQGVRSIHFCPEGTNKSVLSLCACVKSTGCESVTAAEVLNLALCSLCCRSAGFHLRHKWRRKRIFSAGTLLFLAVACESGSGSGCSRGSTFLSTSHLQLQSHSLNPQSAFFIVVVQCFCGSWSLSKCRREGGPDLLILFSHRGSEAQPAVPSQLIHSG